MSNKDYPASPIQLTSGMVGLIAKEDDKAMNDYHKALSGLTKREYAAIKAMQGMLSSEYVSDFSESPKAEMPKGIAIKAVDYADALLKALEETK